MPQPPILLNKDFTAPSVFKPENLLREARRQKRLLDVAVPPVCILDPDGDIWRALAAAGRLQPSPGWACYHSELGEFLYDAKHFGIVRWAVGAPFAVLVAEQLFVSGCRFLVSMTSAGQVTPTGSPPYFVLIDRALRDEGTSYHYQPPADYAEAEAGLADVAMAACRARGIELRCGASWTTDAPFRETEAAIAACRRQDILAVEMEAAALYAFAAAQRRPVLCFAHITNQMAVSEGDFEKGEGSGSAAALAVIAAAAAGWRGWTDAGAKTGRTAG
jgi:purine-nucleoside phosphorylase